MATTGLAGEHHISIPRPSKPLPEDTVHDFPATGVLAYPGAGQRAPLHDCQGPGAARKTGAPIPATLGRAAVLRQRGLYNEDPTRAIKGPGRRTGRPCLGQGEGRALSGARVVSHAADAQATRVVTSGTAGRQKKTVVGSHTEGREQAGPPREGGKRRWATAFFQRPFNLAQTTRFVLLGSSNWVNASAHCC